MSEEIPGFPEPRDYIGDGVYASWNGYAIVLRANDPRSDEREIVLEPEVLEALERFAARVTQRLEQRVVAGDGSCPHCVHLQCGLPPGHEGAHGALFQGATHTWEGPTSG